MFDIIVSGIGIILISPLLLCIAILIKMHSEGPALIKQQRVGYKGNLFVMYKFRTMHITTPLYQKSPGPNGDIRITGYGKILRRTSLDELPQLLNVFVGTMSLVGPRPEMPFIVETYAPWQRKRLDAKPGLTGLWQISGRKDKPLSENLEFDFYYVDHQSFWLDLSIIIKTIPAVLFSRGAY